jgi:cytochrome c-type biogenesis protein CcmH/NrfG
VSVNDQRAAREILSRARPLIERLEDDSRHQEDRAADLIDIWAVIENALRALAGGSALSGQNLVAAVRQRNLITIDQAHAAIEVEDVARRMTSPQASPTSAELDSVRHAFARIEHALLAIDEGAPQLADTTDFATVRRSTDLPLPDEPASGPRHPKRGMPGWAIAAAVLAVIVLAAVVVLIARPGWFSIGASGDLSAGMSAYHEGRLALAHDNFEEAARHDPDEAEPHLWLGRIARDQHEDVTAAREFSIADNLEPDNPLVHREIAAFHLARGRLDPARERYVKALQLDPTDPVSLGWLACTLHRLGREGEARSFAQRAGVGVWSNCLTTPVAPPGMTSAPR